MVTRIRLSPFELCTVHESDHIHRHEADDSCNEIYTMIYERGLTPDGECAWGLAMVYVHRLDRLLII